MQCPGADSLFLRANGNFVCWDDAGSDKILQPYDPLKSMSRIFLDGGPCSLISKKLAGNTLPFPETCPGCYCLSPRGSPCFNSRMLNVMQVEPSSRCTLECKACATPEERERLPLPRTLSPDVFQKVLKDSSGSGIDIRTFDFSGHGEPLMNPDLWQIVSLARKYYPNAFLSLITNAHGNFELNNVFSGLDQIQFSIDGVDQESYEKYRVGGNFAKAYNYMKSFTGAARSSGSSVRMIWRYILFSHNDNTDQLRKAFEMASEIGVHELRFVFTHKGKWSTDITSYEELRSCLIDLEVPSRSIHMDSFKSLRNRQTLSQLLKRSQILYCAARRLWRKVKRSPSLSTRVTSDFYQLYEPELEQILNLGSKLLRKGRLRDAQALFLHVNRMVQLPVSHNATYDPGIIYKHLGRSYKRLKNGLNNYETDVSIRMKTRKTAGNLLKSVHLLHAGRYTYRKLIGQLKTLQWRLQHGNELAPDGLPYPPPHLCFPVAANYDPAHFFSTGKTGAAAILKILQKNGRNIDDFERILDFGCGCGRIARHWRSFEELKMYGTDINPKLIEWSRKNLTFGQFSTNRLESSLKYADNSFDFVFAVAVFGHFREELQKHWMKELYRVLKPQGFLLVTIKGKNRIGELTDKEAAKFRSGRFVVIEPECSGANYCLAYHPDSYFRNVLADQLEVLYYEPSGSPDTVQDVYLLRK